ncbi:hypothetical protein KJ633_05025 [bacterium]|nr:hypothetical protein [bacterium]MBU3955805.1 hypothetical protein [bacterium]MBU4133747.1 hypothetical protein [bacterium]
MNSRVLIGRIGRKHGLGGEFYLTSFVPLPHELPAVFLEETPDSFGEDARKIEIDSLTSASGKWLIAFKDETDSLTGKYISAEKYELADGFYWQDELIGCEVSDPAGVKLGRLAEILEDASQVWVKIETASGETMDVPFLERFVKKVDTAAKKIIADFPESVVVRGE